MAILASAGGAGASELRLRVLSSIVLGIVALGSLWAGGVVLALVWFGAAAAFALEWIAMARAGPKAVLGAAAVAGLGGAQVALLFGSLPIAAASLAAAAAVMLIAAGSGRDRAWAVPGFLYAAPVALVPLALRLAGPAGAVALVAIFGIVWTTDITAYFVGRSLGGPKLWPAVSPKKTWSGFTGGLLGGILAGTLVAILAERWDVARVPSLFAVIPGSALASVASQLGDLGESAMKRRFGVKDSGRSIPGHGGFMDRLDGFAAVTALVGVLLLFSALQRSATP